MDSNTSKSVIISAVIALVVGIGGGYAVGKSMESDQHNNMMSQTEGGNTSKSAQLGITMDGLLREHVSSSLVVTRNIVDGASEAKLKGSEAAQTANAVAIAEAVGSVYGDEAKMAITTPFVEHIGNSNNYAKAVAANDMAAQEASLTALQVNLRQVATVFNSVIPSLSTDTLYDALNAHEGLLNESIKQYQAGNFEKSYQLENEALMQISGGATALTGGIVESKPEMFR